MPETAVVGPTLGGFEEARDSLNWCRAGHPHGQQSLPDDILGSPVYLDPRTLAHGSSIRGAYNRLSLLTDEEKARGVVAASAGNHAQGISPTRPASSASRRPSSCPSAFPLPKLQATKDYGAEVVLRGHTVDEPLRAAADFARTTGAVFIHPFDHEDIIAGQGTLGLEIFDRQPDATRS